MKVSGKGTKLTILSNGPEGIILPENTVQFDKVGEMYVAEIIVDLDLYYSSKKDAKEQKEDSEYLEALDLVLNRDPKAPYKWSGKKLGDILANDKEWLIWAYNNLLNKYVLPAVKLICEKNKLV